MTRPVDTKPPKPRKPLRAIDPAKLMKERIEAGADEVEEVSVPETRSANAASGSEGRDDLHRAVDEMFAKFQLAWHNQFRKAFPDQPRLNRAKRYWHENLSRFSAAQILRATDELATASNFMPSLADVVRICRDDTALFGLPPVRGAYQEACLKPGPKAEQDWSHEAVYLAGSATGWELLASEPEAVSFPLFEYHYLALCRQVVEGARLKIERPTPLPSQVQTELSPEELRELAADLRRELGS